MRRHMKRLAVLTCLALLLPDPSGAAAQPVLFFEEAPDVDDLKRELGLKPRTRSVGGGKRRQLLNPQTNERYDTPAALAAAPSPPDGVTLLGGKWFGSLVQFEINRAEIRSSQHDILDTIGRLLREEAHISVIVSGHADKSGGDAINRPLSSRRAEAVKAFLTRRYGIRADRMRTVGASADQPLEGISAFDPRNRRVQFGFLR